MLIYARVGLILTPTTPSPPPFSGYLFPELRHISPVLISRTNITFFHYTQGERERERESSRSDYAGYFRLWTRDREIPRREIIVSEVGRFSDEKRRLTLFIPDNREGMCENFLRGIHLLATVALFLRKCFIFRYIYHVWRIEFFVCKLLEIYWISFLKL